MEKGALKIATELAFEALSFAAAEFYRDDQSRNSKEHFGLGLASAKQIVTSLGGTKA